MIQTHYATMYSPNISIEYPIPMGSKQGLRQIEINGEVYWGSNKRSLATGFADIIDWGEGGLYEIKPHSGKSLGVVTVGWYLYSWNLQVQQGGPGQYLKPGGRYALPPGVIIGTDPKDSNKWITAELYQLNGVTTGVILYGTLNKTNPRPVPVWVFEWNPASQRVEKKRGNQLGKLQPAFSLYPSEDVTKGGLIAICTYLTIRAGIQLAKAAFCGPCALSPVP